MTAKPGGGAERLANAAVGALLALTTLGVITVEWGGPKLADFTADILVAAAIAIMAAMVDRGRRAFVWIALTMMALAAARLPDPAAAIFNALDSAAFIAAFFTALTALRHAAQSSRAIETAGRYLADQPPGKRYAALTFGGQLFGLILGYASVSLLGALAEAGAEREPDPRTRERRKKRMLLAIMRGFVSTLTWSPLAFAVAISTSLVPGADWARALPALLVSAVVLVLVGWAIDRFDKRRGAPTAFAPPAGTWRSLWPLSVLLGCLALAAAIGQRLAEIRTIAIVMTAAPVISVLWMGLQNLQDRPAAAALQGARAYVFRELPGFRSEILIVSLAGFIGTLGADLLAPILGEATLRPAGMPAAAFLVALVWMIPITGQLGLNPILFATLAVPLMPAPEALGVEPSAYILAITAGWALSGASSPFTATTLMVGAIGRVPARHVGLRWNGGYVLIAGMILSAWVVVYSGL